MRLEIHEQSQGWNPVDSSGSRLSAFAYRRAAGSRADGVRVSGVVFNLCRAWV